MTPIKIAKYVALAAAAGTLVLFVVWAGTGGAGGFQLLTQVMLVILGHAILTIGHGLALERGKAERWMWLGILLAAVGAVLWTTVILGLVQKERWAVIAGTATTGWATILMVAGIALSQPVNTRPARVARAATLTLAGMLGVALLVYVLLLADRWAGADAALRACAILGLLAVVGLLTNVVLPRIAGVSSGDAARSTPVVPSGSLHMTCPRCTCRQLLSLGGAACERCGLRIRVEIP